MPNWTEEDYAQWQAKQQAAPPADSDPSPELTLEVCPDAKAARKVQRREQAEQIEYFDHVRECLRVDPATGIASPLPGREGAERIFGLANENAAGRDIGILRWKMGVKAGLPDIGVFVTRMIATSPTHVRHCSGLFIELKTSGGVASDVRASQRAVHDGLHAAGYKVAVCFGWREAWAVTCEYLGWE